MKIAYVVNDDITVPSGVIQKISEQIKIWEKHGHVVKVFSLSSTGTDPLISNGIIVGQKIQNSKIKKFFHYFEKVNALNSALQVFQPDLIYTRYLMYWPTLISALKNNAPYMVEINSNDVIELKSSSRLYYLYNQLTRDFFLSNASAFVSVSHELMHQYEFAKFQKPYTVIANGIDTSLIQHVRKKGLSKTPKAVFVGTPNQRWHGLDKLSKLFFACPEIHFYLIGPSKEMLLQEGLDINQVSNVTCFGYLPQNETEIKIAECDVGISTLALHRKYMSEASPLKSRQYLAQGLPIIAGYNDSDFSTLSLPFVLNIGNYENNVDEHLEKIKKFIHDSQHIDPDLIRQYAKTNLDRDAKEKTRLNYFRKILLLS